MEAIFGERKVQKAPRSEILEAEGVDASGLVGIEIAAATHLGVRVDSRPFF